MNTATTTKERPSALDDFAARAATSKGELVPMPAASYHPPAERHGAIQVEVVRDTAAVRKAISEAASLLGERGFYRWPVRNKRKGTTDWVEGISIKGANALLRVYGNIRVSCPVIVDMGSHWRFHAVIIDWQNGVEIERSFMQRKSAGKMGDDAERNEDIAYQIGMSKAERNVVLNYLETEADILLEECKQATVDKVGKNLERYRQLVLERAAERGIEVPRIEAAVGRAADKWLAPDITRIIGMMAAINDGMATVNETFPPLTVDKPAGGELEKFASAATGGAPATQPAAEAGAANPQAPPQAAPAPDLDDLREDIIDTVVRVASKFGVDVEDRLLHLENIVLPDAAQFFPDFAKAAVATGVKVARDELAADAARKYLRSLPMRRTT